MKSGASLQSMNNVQRRKRVKYSKDVDVLLIELSDDAIAYAEDEGRVILHYSNNEKLVVIEILDFNPTFRTLDWHNRFLRNWN
jgi:uncharacterized protein YuzE